MCASERMLAAGTARSLLRAGSNDVIYRGNPVGLSCSVHSGTEASLHRGIEVTLTCIVYPGSIHLGSEPGSRRGCHREVGAGFRLAADTAALKNGSRNIQPIDHCRATEIRVCGSRQRDHFLV